MKKLLAILLSLVMCFALVAACETVTDDPGVDDPTNTGSTPPTTDTSPSPTTSDPPVDLEPDALEVLLAEYGLDANLRFINQRNISVAVWDRDTDTDPADNAFTDYIKQGMLDNHNVVVTFQKIGRWTEVEDLTLLLAENDAPDVSYTFNYPVINTFGQQGAITDLQDFFGEGSTQVFPHI